MDLWQVEGNFKRRDTSYRPLEGRVTGVQRTYRHCTVMSWQPLPLHHFLQMEIHTEASSTSVSKRSPYRMDKNVVMKDVPIISPIV